MKYQITPQILYDMIKDAYQNPSSEHKKFLNEQHAILFGMVQSSREDLEYAKELRKVVYQIQVTLFNQGFFSDLGVCPIGFDDVKIKCNANSVVETNIFLHGFYDEILLLEEYRNIVKPGTVCIDVGANIGTHAIPMAKLCENDGKVIAIEPREDIAKLLQENIKINNVSNIEIMNFAAYKEDGLVGFRSNDHLYNQAVGMIDTKSEIKMQAKKMDTILKDVNLPVSLIKIDVEGAEMEVLQGAQETLLAHKPVVVVEYNFPPWNINRLKSCFPFPVQIKRARNTRYEEDLIIEKDSQLSGFNNLIIYPFEGEKTVAKDWLDDWLYEE